jgi:DNA-binding GntR family transcriptional regulator
MTSQHGEKPSTQKRYELISRVLRNNIHSGRLPEGFVLLEGPIAELMQSSRAPVQMALKMLEVEKLIQRFDGRGFLVGQGAATINPKRIDIRTLDLHVSDEIDEALQSRSMWEQVYDQVEGAIASSLIFGEFRIIETELSVHLGVSRTVVRDVLSRLNERGLIRKNQSSHWIAGPLTAQSVRERFAIRSILEPAALRLAAPAIDYAAVERLSRLASEGTSDFSETEDFEQALMDTCIAKVPNAEMIAVIRNIQLPLLAANRALTKLGLPRDRFAADEYRSLFRLIERRLIDPAADYLENHLKVMAQKSLARLKIVAVINESRLSVPYLTKVK